MFPIRCFSCGKALRHEAEYIKAVKDGEHRKSILDRLGYKRFCCRRMYLGYVPLIDKQLRYELPGRNEDDD